MPESLFDVVRQKDKPHVHAWLQENLGRSFGQRMRPATHVGKYSHPDVGSQSSLQAKVSPVPGGYLCSGNFDTRLQDYVGSAAFLPYAKTLESTLEDGRTVREHLLDGTAVLKEHSQVSAETLEAWREAYLEQEQESKRSILTDRRMKQVYYPLGNGQYRLMTLIPCSVLVWELKNRIASREFETVMVDGKEKTRRAGFIPKWQRNYGGTRPQNIGFLNSQNGGRTRALVSLPPVVRQDLRLPKKDFFELIKIFRPRRPESAGSSLWQRFEALYDTLARDPNTAWARKKKLGILRAIIEQGVISPAENIRENASPGWTREEAHAALPEAQKIWLDPYRRHELQESSPLTAWNEKVAEQIAGFIKAGFEKVIKADPQKQTISVDDVFFKEITAVAKEYLDG